MIRKKLKERERAFRPPFDGAVAGSLSIATIKIKSLLVLFFVAYSISPLLTVAFSEEYRPFSDIDKVALKEAFRPSITRLKGPYTENICVCQNGTKAPVRNAQGVIGSPCGSKEVFCSAFRASWAEELIRYRLYLGNIFSRDLYYWDSIQDKHDLVRGYIIEKFFTDTHPEHKLGELRAFGGLSGSEYEAKAAPKFFEVYLSHVSFDPEWHYLLLYELQRRYFLRGDAAHIDKVRQGATRIHAKDKSFKPLRDAIHNQISSAMLPRLKAYIVKQTNAEIRKDAQSLYDEIEKLTNHDIESFRDAVNQLSHSGLKAELLNVFPVVDANALEQLQALSKIAFRARTTVNEKNISSITRRELVDLVISAVSLSHNLSNQILESSSKWSLKDQLSFLHALTRIAYASGLLHLREFTEIDKEFSFLVSSESLSRQRLRVAVKRMERVIEWAQTGVMSVLGQPLEAWKVVLPEVDLVIDDILRSSSLLQYAQGLRKFSDRVEGNLKINHEFFGESISDGIRALNPGIVRGELRFNPRGGAYTRENVTAFPQTPADLEPSGGIITQGEGNLLSHVQLLARALGIPNIFLAADTFRKLESFNGKELFYLVTPNGRVILKLASAMSETENAAFQEYYANVKRTGAGELGKETGKLKIEVEKLKLNETSPRSLAQVRRSDSGVICGPKAAYLGELKALFPDNVSRGVIVPFGVYFEHFKRAKVSVPQSIKSLGIASVGESLSVFVERTYDEFFGKLIPEGANEKKLSDWIRPRLEIIQLSIRETPLSDEFRKQLHSQLEKEGLLGRDGTLTGSFVRSDTNVEDLDNFNGAGLNLTLFNLTTLKEIEEGMKEVWASPFSYRSFSWRQTLIDKPLWVLPSIVILESVASEKSGVLVTSDVEVGDQSKMLIATSEGVGGVVDGTPAETLLWSPIGVELLTMFKSPWRRLLSKGGGSKFYPSSGESVVLKDSERAELVAKTQQLKAALVPVKDPFGRPRPWDIEFGFNAGKLWLFQVRPFIGNDEVKNLRALKPLEAVLARGDEVLRLEDI